MTTFLFNRRAGLWLAALSIAAIGVTGCDQGSSAYFVASSSPRIELERRIKSQTKTVAEATDEQTKKDTQEALDRAKKELEELPAKQKAVSTIIAAMFGTPDNPIVLAETNLDETKVRLAAGPAAADQKGNTGGLYRRHCVHCHGVTGNGGGPTAEFLNPYPRDFRHGNFKFKSTKIGQKPTNEDLHRVLYEGLNGTAMPSFRLLPPAELDALVEYVKYLSIRGETENALYSKWDELGVGDLIKNANESDAGKAELKKFLMEDILSDVSIVGVAARWQQASEQIVELAPRPEESLEASIRKGRDLFYGAGGCVKCHGDSAMGDGQVYAVNEPDTPRGQTIKPLVNPALPPQELRPRNLRYSSIRGPHRDRDLFRRMRNGIDVVGMPAPSIPPEQIWHLVDYVQNLPYELQEPEKPQSENTRAN